jgi:3-hydroxybutyryl-CoA dehydrogenase
MTMMQIGVIGAGAMGAGIAQVAATAGHTVYLYDISDAALQKARQNLTVILSRLIEKGKLDQATAEDIEKRHRFTGNLADLQPCGLVIEAIIELQDIKVKTFRDLENILDAKAILASNTSSLSITALASGLNHPERFVGLHFFNPAPLMPLVEVIPALQSRSALAAEMMDLMRSWGKVPVLAKDTPGFIVNRIARPYYSESLRIVEEGLADTHQLDHIMRTYGGFRMGPFELMDFIGHDVNLAVTESVWQACHYEPRYQPSFAQRQLVNAGWLGRKSGRGFYDYSTKEERPAAAPMEAKLEKNLFERVMVMLFNEAADALYYRIASREDIDTAMTKGVNYPKGLLTWADEWGLDRCMDRLDQLFDYYHDPRYRCSPGLRRQLAENSGFYSASTSGI